MSDKSGEIGFWGAWSMGVGGMIGGGIFSTLGVVIAASGHFAWAAFLLGGIIALAAAYCMSALTADFGQSGGIYRFLRQLGYDRSAKIAAWILIAGYTLTVAVYAYTFGAYLGNALGGPSWLPQAMAAAAIALLAGVNLRSVGTASTFETLIVIMKLVILGGLAAMGLSKFDASRLDIASQPGVTGILVGAASVFMAYEGFEMLSYDYDEMKDRKRLIRKAMPIAVVTAIGVYIAVALAVPMLADTSEIIKDGEVALAKAGQDALGTAGLVAITIAAALSTGSAINATLFSTARLAHDVAKEDELPELFEKTNSAGAPYVAILLLSAAALALALVGGLDSLVKGASFVFLAVFGVTSFIALRHGIAHRGIALFGTVGTLAAAIMLALHLAGVV